MGDRVLCRLRRGELIALRWSDIDLAKSEIRVERGWDEVEGPISAKSKKGKRTVPIPAALSDYLREHRATTWTDGFVFGEAPEIPLRAGSLRGRGKRLWIKKGMAPITLHECRHTYASLMIAAGVNFKALSDFMGHSDIGITLDRYGHLLPGAGDEAAELLDKYLNDWQAQTARQAALSEADAPLTVDDLPASEHQTNTVSPLSTTPSSHFERSNGHRDQGQVSA